VTDDNTGWRTRRYLPHFDGVDVLQHIVFRLADSLPPDILARSQSGPAAARMEATASALDAGTGARHLSDARAADIVRDALLHFDGERYGLIAWCVMPTHVHVLIERKDGWTVSSVVHSWKSFTANAINRLLGLRGSFWAREYYDRLMRDADQGEATLAYIENNPVKAGLCQLPEDWPWSSSYHSYRRLPAGPFPADP
jgi:REP element-mobilizing transposase RayT